MSHLPAQKRGIKIFLTLVALLTGGVSPVFLLLLSTGRAFWIQGLTKMPEVLASVHAFAKSYLFVVLLPSLLVLLAVMFYSRGRFPDLYNRIWAGLAAGAIATVFLDFFRELGVIHGWLPTDTSIFFGKMILGTGASLGAVLPVGFLYHFLNGASFGLPYTLLFGRVHWYWGILWGLFYELGMMTLPPMGAMFGPFGIKTGGPGLFLITFVAHIAFGMVLGVLAERWVETPGTLFSLWQQKDLTSQPTRD